MTSSNSAYIAYRRGIGGVVARAVFQDLLANGFDAFMDVESLRGEQNEQVLLNQISSRAYFVLVLTPGTLEQCAESGDWLRLQIEHAVAQQRKIVPLVSPKFNLDSAMRFLPGPLGEALARATPVKFTHSNFKESMDKLRTQTLKTVEVVLTPTPEADAEPVARILAEAKKMPEVVNNHLLAQEHFERAFTRQYNDWDGRIGDYTEAIKLYPEFVEAYARRGANRDVKGDLDGALADCNEALRLRPSLDTAYVNRGIIYFKKNALDAAIQDFDEALRLNPQLAPAYYNRGLTHNTKGDYVGAISDHTEAIKINPRFAGYYHNRGLAKANNKDFDGALEDYSKAIELDPTMAAAFYNRGLAQLNLTNINAAIADWTEAIRLNPNFGEAYYNRGLVRARRHDLEGTIEDMTKVLDLMPDGPEVQEVRKQIEEIKRMKSDLGM